MGRAILLRWTKKYWMFFTALNIHEDIGFLFAATPNWPSSTACYLKPQSVEPICQKDINTLINAIKIIYRLH